MAKFSDRRNLDIGQVSATREIARLGESKRYLLVEIGVPQQFEDEPRDWYCVYRISGPDHHRRFASCGIDGVQALQLAVAAVGAELLAINKKLGGTLRWLDQKDLGFPIPS